MNNTTLEAARDAFAQQLLEQIKALDELMTYRRTLDPR